MDAFTPQSHPLVRRLESIAEPLSADELQAALSQLQAENTLLGSIVQQLQTERHKQTAQLQHSRTVQEQQQQRIIQLEQEQIDTQELKDALIEAHTSLDEQTTALRVQ